MRFRIPQPRVWPGVFLLACAIASAQTAPCMDAAARDALLHRINAARATARTCGGARMAAVPALAWSDLLLAPAQAHSRDMARRNYLDHTSPDGQTLEQRADAARYPWRAIGENIAGGQRSVDAVMAGWLRSPPHCENIMSPEFTEVAAACAQAPGTEWGTYWTMVFGRRR
jgi:uncharacterized protein YkwD